MTSNETMAIIFGVVALIILLINFYYSSQLVDFLKSKGEKASFAAIRWKIFDYLRTYKRITLAEFGETGQLYAIIRNLWIIFFVIIAVAIWFSAKG